jgi:hypothetical protein
MIIHGRIIRLYILRKAVRNLSQDKRESGQDGTVVSRIQRQQYRQLSGTLRDRSYGW